MVVSRQSLRKSQSYLEGSRSVSSGTQFICSVSCCGFWMLPMRTAVLYLLAQVMGAALHRLQSEKAVFVPDQGRLSGIVAINDPSD